MVIQPNVNKQGIALDKMGEEEDNTCAKGHFQYRGFPFLYRYQYQVIYFDSWISSISMTALIIAKPESDGSGSYLA